MISNNLVYDSDDLVCDFNNLIWFLMIWLYELAVYLTPD